MKKQKWMVLAAALLVSGLAHADYKCTSNTKELTMTVDEKHFTRHGADTSIWIMSQNGSKHFFGKTHTEQGVVTTKKVIDFFSHQQKGDTLTIVSKSPFCGRGACDKKIEPSVTAQLKVGQVATYFYCNVHSL